MVEKLKKIHLSFSLLGILCGIVSFYLANTYIAFLIALLVYVASFFVVKALKLLEQNSKIFVETFLSFFGFWFLVWVLLFNIL